MATHEIDQKLLGRLATHTAPWSPIVASHLYRVLGLSMILNRHLIRARRSRNSDKYDDEGSVNLTHHIVFLAREGLACAETCIIPMAEGAGASIELKIFAAKLRASFFHIFCLYRNSPPIKQVKSVSLYSGSTATPRPLSQLPMTHQKSNSQLSNRASPSLTPKGSKNKRMHDESNKENIAARPSQRRLKTPGLHVDAKHLDVPLKPSPPIQTLSPRGSLPTSRRKMHLRETIPSVLSDESFVTNPYSGHRSSIRNTLPFPLHNGDRTRSVRETTISALSVDSYITNPYAALHANTPPPRHLSPVTSPGNFLLPPHDYVPQTLGFFIRVSELACTHLSGSAPLRLSVACEYASFLGECMEDWDGAREVARAAVKESHKAWVEIGGEQFDDAMPFVAFLVRLVRDGTDGMDAW